MCPQGESQGGVICPSYNAVIPLQCHAEVRAER